MYYILINILRRRLSARLCEKFLVEGLTTGLHGVLS